MVQSNLNVHESTSTNVIHITYSCSSTTALQHNIFAWAWASKVNLRHVVLTVMLNDGHAGQTLAEVAHRMCLLWLIRYNYRYRLQLQHNISGEAKTYSFPIPNSQCQSLYL